MEIKSTGRRELQALSTCNKQQPMPDIKRRCQLWHSPGIKMVYSKRHLQIISFIRPNGNFKAHQFILSLGKWYVTRLWQVQFTDIYKDKIEEPWEKNKSCHCNLQHKKLFFFESEQNNKFEHTSHIKLQSPQCRFTGFLTISSTKCSRWDILWRDT